ncbi:hypothetical protein CPB86DRAFT_821668 [Serendipita vermifera]|nr:hypothetical protein CPB86DRAFT_821668 [Serendipita vermifera]
MSVVLHDKIYGREIATRPRKVMITGRGGSGNARKSVSSASGESTVGSYTSVALSPTKTTLGSDRSTRTRRWSSASDDFLSVVNMTREVDSSDRADLYTISSHSTSTNNSAVLSDIPSYISEYTFRTSSNPSASRPSTRSSNSNRQSAQTDWVPRISRSYSSDSLPRAIAQGAEDSGMPSSSQGSIVFMNPWDNYSANSLATFAETRQSTVGPFDGSDLPDSPQTPQSKSSRRFLLFKRQTAGISRQESTAPSAYQLGSLPRFGQSNETLNIRSASVPTEPPSPVAENRRRNSNPLASAKMLLRVGQSRDK